MTARLSARSILASTTAVFAAVLAWCTPAGASGAPQPSGSTLSSAATTRSSTTDYTADGRLPVAQLTERFATLASQHGWRPDEIFAYSGASPLRISAWRTTATGPALWVLAGIHGEEPAGPNAIAQRLPRLVALARERGVPIVLIPLCNPQAYQHNWRYPNTPERDWKKGGGYSVGDSGYLLPDLGTGNAPREAAAAGSETRALTQYVLRTASAYPPRLVLDLHEDELSREGGYIYSQGVQADANPVGAEIVRLLQSAGIPLRTSGQTRFGEPIVDGVISRDDKGGPIRDSSIDELLAAPEVVVDGRKLRGPSGATVIVVETPAFAGSQLERRVAAHGAVIEHLDRLWDLVGTIPAP